MFSHFWGFCPPWFWSFGGLVLWCFCPFLLFSLRPCDGMTRMLIVHTCIMWSWDHTPWLLESLNIFSFLGVLSALILILCGFRPVVLLSIFAFLCAATWWHDENVDCPHLYHVIMGSYNLIVVVLKYFLIFGGFVRLDSDPLGLSSYSAFVHFFFSLCDHVMAWRECWLSTPVSCDHGIVHLDCWSLKIFSHFGGFCPPWFWSFGGYVLYCFCPFLVFSVWPRDGMTRMLIVHNCIMWSWDRTPWLLESLNIFSFLGVLSALMLILWGFRPIVLLSIFAFLCAATWWHDENVDCPHLYHVIMGSYTLIVGVLKYFLIFGGFVRLDADPLGLLSCGAFVHFCFSLCGHVMAWRECWLSTPVSCNYGIIHLDCWSLKIFSHFWGFCPPWCSSFGAFVLWCFCPFLLFPVWPRDGMTRMLIVHTCIMWSWDRTPWLLES